MPCGEKGDDDHCRAGSRRSPAEPRLGEAPDIRAEGGKRLSFGEFADSVNERIERS